MGNCESCCLINYGEGGINAPEGSHQSRMPTGEEMANIQKGLAASQIVLFGQARAARSTTPIPHT